MHSTFGQKIVIVTICFSKNSRIKSIRPIFQSLKNICYKGVNINSNFPWLQDVINIFSKTEVELSLVLRDIKSQDLAKQQETHQRNRCKKNITFCSLIQKKSNSSLPSEWTSSYNQPNLFDVVYEYSPW